MSFEKRKLLSIGEFSSLSGINIKKLRYYDRIGILKPAYIDEETNYRYYTFVQKYIAEIIIFCSELDIPFKNIGRFIDKNNNINYEEIASYGKKLALNKIKIIKSNLNFIEAMEKDLKRCNDLYFKKQAIYKMNKKICYVIPFNKNQTSVEFHVKIQQTIQKIEKEGYTPSYEFGLISLFKNNEVNTYLFIDLENINLEKKNKNIIILPESYYYCILCDYSEIKTNVKVYDNLLKINKDRIIIESELYSDYSKIASPIFELRCSLNENEAAEILKKIAN